MPTISNGLYDLAFGKCLLVKRHVFYSESFVQFQASVTNSEAQRLIASTLRQRGAFRKGQNDLAACRIYRLGLAFGNLVFWLAGNRGIWYVGTWV